MKKHTHKQTKTKRTGWKHSHLAIADDNHTKPTVRQLQVFHYGNNRFQQYIFTNSQVQYHGSDGQLWRHSKTLTLPSILMSVIYDEYLIWIEFTNGNCNGCEKN